MNQSFDDFFDRATGIGPCADGRRFAVGAK